MYAISEVPSMLKSSVVVAATESSGVFQFCLSPSAPSAPKFSSQGRQARKLGSVAGIHPSL